MSEHNIIYDPAFEIIPKNSTFFLIWRVEKLKIVPIPKEDYGKFYNGDSYIVGCATEYKGKGNSQMESKVVAQELYIDIHFWIGSKSTLDEAGVAAIKTVEMDEYLGGSPIQHRETEGHESQRFLSYFKKGIRVLVGGIATGFRKVDYTIAPALYHVKGKRRPIVKELSEINWLPFNDGDIYILATGKYIFLWTGKHANNMEKVQAIRIAEAIREEHSHYSEKIVIVDDNEEIMELSSDELKAFEQYLPLDKKCVDSYDPKEDELKYENTERIGVVLYRCNGDNGSVQINKVKNGPLVKSDLDSNDTFIIDNDVDGIWVWVGKKASKQERSGAMKYANQLIQLNKYSPKTRVTKVIESSEPIEFKSLFKSWPTGEKALDFSKPFIGRVAKIVDNKIDNNTIKDDHKLSAETQLLDDGNGRKEIFYVQNTELIPLKDEHLGQFFKQNCYVIVYTYDTDKVFIYYWFGSESLPNERNIAETKAVELDSNRFDNNSVLVRLIECEETIHFLLIFRGLMAIYKGRYDPNKSSDSHLLQVKGITEYNSKLVEVDRNANSLNSNCVFVLTLPNKNFIWAGNRSFGDKREIASKFVQKDSNKESQLVSEGEESDEFWEALGGKGSYESTKEDKHTHDFQTARFFEWRKNRFEEIVKYSQKDLNDEDIIILDAFDVMFIWLGNTFKHVINNTKAVRIVEEFIAKDVKNRNKNIAIHVIKQGCEPTNFTGFFNKWNKKFWDKKENFEDLKREMRKSFMKKFPINN